MTFYQYLSQNGLLHMLDASKEEISAQRKEYGKICKREYRREYAKKRVYKTVVFSNEEFSLLKKASENHQLPFSSFVRQSCLKYLSNGYIVPNREQVKAMLVAFKKYGTNLNQISHKCNTQNFVSDTDVKNVHENFSLLEKTVKRIFTEPTEITGLVRKFLANKPEHAPTIREIAEEFEKPGSLRQ